MEIEKNSIESQRNEITKKCIELDRREKDSDNKILNFEDKQSEGITRAQDDQMRGLRVERELLQKKIRTIDSELLEVADLRRTVEVISKRNNEISTQLSDEKNELTRTREKNRSIEHQYDDQKENW